MHTDINIVKKWAAENGIDVSDTQLLMLEQHQSCVLETNKHMNLTTITNPRDFAVKHIIDSLTLLPYIPLGVRLADIGTGAGFPGLAIAIMREDLHVTLIDSLRKRVFFLQKTVDVLGLTNVECIHTRAEDLARGGVGYDICTARAVARMDRLAKWVLPITKEGGTFLAMKSTDVFVELSEAQLVIKKLGGVVKRVDTIEISPGLSHCIVVVEKIN